MSRFVVRAAWRDGDGSRAIVSRHETLVAAVDAAADLRAKLGAAWNVWAAEVAL